MNPEYLGYFIVLFQMMAVIVILAYFVTRITYFSEVLSGIFTWKNQILLTLFFGLVSIYGTESGISILGAPINIRDLGPMVGGLSCGPIVGCGAGIIGGIYRMTLGGFTCTACTLATILAGFFAGAIYLLNHRRFVGWQLAVAFAVIMEGIHMGIVLLVSKPFSQAFELVSIVAAPMNLVNAAGMLVFALIIGNLIAERRTKEERDRYGAELERKKAELQVARTIQESLLPRTLPTLPGMELAAKALPATEVGGDFYDTIPLSGDSSAMLIGDVSGKGVPAALFLSLSRTVVRANTGWHDRSWEVIRDSNKMIAADAASGMFITLFFGVLDFRKRQLTYVKAGHNPPLLVHADATSEELAITGIALGALDSADYEERMVSLSAGDVIVLYTDGVTEAVNDRDEQFGTVRLEGIVRDAHTRPAENILDRILQEIAAFTGDTPQFDDITLMVVKVTSP